MAAANLIGQGIPMTGQIPIAGGHNVVHEGRKAFVFEKAPEAEAFLR